MKRETLKKITPTVADYLEKREAKKKNQLPKRLQPVSQWPIAIQIVLNFANFSLFWYLIMYQLDFLTIAGPAALLVVGIVMQIYLLVTAYQLKNRYAKIPGRKWAMFNVVLMWTVFLMVPITIVNFMD